jgi:hypothetical protein
MRGAEDGGARDGGRSWGKEKMRSRKKIGRSGRIRGEQKKRGRRRR